MKPGDCFSIHVQVPEGTQAPSGSDSEGGGPSVRIRWTDEGPFLTALGRAGGVLLNATPVEPNRPVAILQGDTITIGSARLTWNAEVATVQADGDQEEARDPRATLPLPPEEPLKPGPAAAVAGDTAPAAPSERSAALVPEEPPRRSAAQIPFPVDSDDAAPAEPPDATMYIPKEVAARVRAAASDPALQEPAADTPGDPGHRPPAQGPDSTLVVPKEAAQPAAAEPVAQQTPIQREPTLVVPKPSTGAPDPGRPEPGAPDDSAIYRTAWVDMAEIAAEDADLEFDSTTILRDNETPHLIVHTPGRTWSVPFDEEAVTIGRGHRSDIVLDDEAVSQYHALIERRSDGFAVRDTGSRNGVWLGGKRVDEHRLRDGDVVSVGRAKVVFKGGFTSDDLTLLGPPQIEGKPERRPVVFVPGLMGTELWIGSERIWPNPKIILTNPEVYAMPGDPRIEPRGILNDVIIVPHLIQSRQYSAMGDYLVSGLGYTRGKDLLEFGYDWRQDVRLSAQRLAEAIDSWKAEGPVTIIAHSLGTLVTRYYVERLGGKDKVERIVLMGGPYHGTPKALAGVLFGPDMFPLGYGAERMRAVLSTFPSSFQILPTYRCVVDQDGADIDLLEDTSWLPEPHRPLLHGARSYFREVGSTSSVPAVSVFGYGLKTKVRAKVDRGTDGAFRKVVFTEDNAGDQSVPSGSAVVKGSEIHPVLQEHGSLYVDDDVRMRLKVELTRSTRWQGKWK